MLGGGLVVSLSLVGLSNSEALARSILSNVPSTSLLEMQVHDLAQTMAVIWFLFLNLGIQPLQVSSRAYIVDCNPENHVLANAWASRVQGICGILGFALSAAPLERLIPLGDRASGFTLLCTSTSFLLVSMICVACVSRPHATCMPVSDTESAPMDWTTKDCSLLRTVREMPQSVRSVYFVQWFAWMGWFPFLAYYTT